MNNLVLNLNELGMNNESGIEFPHQGYATLSEIEFDQRQTNRDIDDSHVGTMTNKIRLHGFLDSIKVFPKNEYGKYIVAESQHRVEALKALIESNPPGETLLPISVLQWVDPTDQEEVQQTILALNMGVKNWTIYDFVKSNSNVKSRTNHKDFIEILESMRRYSSSMSNNLVAQIYSGQMMTHDKLRDGTYVISDSMRPYYNLMLESISTWLIGCGKNKVGAYFLRFLVNEMHRTIKSLNTIDDDNNLPKFSTFNKILQRSLNDAAIILNAPNSFLPTSAEHFNEWFRNIRESFIPKSSITKVA